MIKGRVLVLIPDVIGGAGPGFNLFVGGNFVTQAKELLFIRYGYHQSMIMIITPALVLVMQGIVNEYEGTDDCGKGKNELNC